MAAVEVLSEELYPIGTDIVTKYIGRDSEGYGNFTEGKNIDSKTGEYVDYDNAASDVYIPISPYYTYQKSGWRLYNGTWYDENYDRISSFSLNNLQVQLLPKAPENARYFRFATHPTAKSNWRITITRIPVTSHSLQEARRRILLNTPHITTESSNPLTFQTDISANLKDCKIYFEPIQEGSGDPSPENVRPISGWDGATVYKTGENFITSDIDWLPKRIRTLNNVISGSVYYSFYFPVPKGTLHLYKRTTSISYMALADKIPEIGDTVYNSRTITNHNGFDITMDNTDGHPYMILCGPTVAPTSSVYEFAEDNEVYVGTVPYSDITGYPKSQEGTSLTIPFPKTIYGGYVDLVKGEVVETWGKFDMGDKTWSSSWGGFYTGIADIEIQTINERQTPVVCDIYPTGISKPAGALKELPMHVNIRTNYYHTYIKDDNYASASDFKTAVTGHEIAYKLATPITHQLTPQVIKTLKGINNIWSDANGNIEVKFWKH